MDVSFFFFFKQVHGCFEYKLLMHGYLFQIEMVEIKFGLR